MSESHVGRQPGDLTPDQLRAEARRLAAEQTDLSALDRSNARSFVELRCDDHVGGWLIHWGGEADTGFHDHDNSNGAITVLSGRVREERLRLDGPPVVNEYGPGETFTVDSSEIHRVLHVGEEPATTVHAYSPPLVRMGSYVVEASGALTRHSVSYDEELRSREIA